MRLKKKVTFQGPEANFTPNPKCVICIEFAVPTKGYLVHQSSSPIVNLHILRVLNTAPAFAKPDTGK